MWWWWWWLYAAAASSFCGGVGGEKKNFLVLSRSMHVVVVVRNTVECGESRVSFLFLSLSLFLPCLLLLSFLVSLLRRNPGLVGGM